VNKDDPDQKMVQCSTTGCINWITEECYQELHSCAQCRCRCHSCGVFADVNLEEHIEEHKNKLLFKLELLLAPIVESPKQKFANIAQDIVDLTLTGALTSNETSRNTSKEANTVESIMNDEDEQGRIVCSDRNLNPTKDFTLLPFGNWSKLFEYEPEFRYKIDPTKPYEYCYKCYSNTESPYLKYCDLCNSLSFINCGQDTDILDSESIPIDKKFFCCYCVQYKRSLNFLFDPATSDYFNVGNKLVEWEMIEEQTDKKAREQYKSSRDQGRTANEYSDRLYGIFNDASEELAQIISLHYLRGEKPVKYECFSCCEYQFDNLDLNIASDKMLCIGCAMHNFYHDLDIKLQRDKRVSMRTRQYDAGYYPATYNMISLPYHHSVENHILNKITKEDLLNFYFNNHFTGDAEKFCRFVMSDDWSIRRSSDVEAYFIYDNTYFTTTMPLQNTSCDVYIQEIVPIGRKIAMLFFKGSCAFPLFSDDPIRYQLYIVPISQYSDMVKCRYSSIVVILYYFNLFQSIIVRVLSEPLYDCQKYKQRYFLYICFLL